VSSLSSNYIWKLNSFVLYRHPFGGLVSLYTQSATMELINQGIPIQVISDSSVQQVLDIENT
jgi:hypothetical protein